MPNQLAIYVPKDRVTVLTRLDEAARHTGRPKNELVLDAIEAYLEREPPRFEPADLGTFEMPSRAELYEEMMNHRSSSDSARR